MINRGTRGGCIAAPSGLTGCHHPDVWFLSFGSLRCISTANIPFLTTAPSQNYATISLKTTPPVDHRGITPGSMILISTLYWCPSFLLLHSLLTQPPVFLTCSLRAGAVPRASNSRSRSTCARDPLVCANKASLARTRSMMHQRAKKLSTVVFAGKLRFIFTRAAAASASHLIPRGTNASSMVRWHNVHVCSDCNATSTCCSRAVHGAQGR